MVLQQLLWVMNLSWYMFSIIKDILVGWKTLHKKVENFSPLLRFYREIDNEPLHFSTTFSFDFEFL